MQERLDGHTVSLLVPTLVSGGHFFHALHHWLALKQQAAGEASLYAQQALLMACQQREAWPPALCILQAMLDSQVGSVIFARIQLHTPCFCRMKSKSERGETGVVERGNAGNDLQQHSQGRL